MQIGAQLSASMKVLGNDVMLLAGVTIKGSFKTVPDAPWLALTRVDCSGLACARLLSVCPFLVSHALFLLPCLSSEILICL